MIGRNAVSQCGSVLSFSVLNSSSVSWYLRDGSLKVSPFPVNFLALYSSQTNIMANMAAVVMRDGTNAAVAGVPRFVMAI